MVHGEANGGGWMFGAQGNDRDRMVATILSEISGSQMDDDQWDVSFLLSRE